MKCPRCKIQLEEKTIREYSYQIEVDECGNCGGIWFDESELQKIENVREAVMWENRKLPKRRDQLKGLVCPKCKDGRLMKKAEHPRDEKVILDYCENCRGIWLDKGELEAIQKENIVKTIWNFMKVLHG